MKKDRNTFFQEANMSTFSNQAFPQQVPFNYPINMPLGQAQYAQQSFSAGAYPTYVGNSQLNSNDYSDLESRMAKLERQINRLETRIQKLENQSYTTPDYEINQNQNMYMI